MRVLAIDTALEACAAAVLDTERRRVAAQESQPMVRGHAEALMPLIERVMRAAAVDFAELDRIAVTIGPGSFTGLRVGIAAARGIALAADKPAVGLSTLAAFAAPLIAADDGVPVVAAIDARHEHVYLQVFGAGGRTLVAPRIAPLREAVQRAAASGAPRLAGNAARHAGRRLAGERAAARARRAERRARHRLGGAARRRRAGHRRAGRSRFICARPTPSRRTPASCRADDRASRQSVRPRRAGAVRSRERATPPRSPRCTPPRSSAAGASRKSTACCSTAT